MKQKKYRESFLFLGAESHRFHNQITPAIRCIPQFKKTRLIALLYLNRGMPLLSGLIDYGLFPEQFHLKNNWNPILIYGLQRFI